MRFSLEYITLGKRSLIFLVIHSNTLIKSPSFLRVKEIIYNMIDIESFLSLVDKLVCNSIDTIDDIVLGKFSKELDKDEMVVV